MLVGDDDNDGVPSALEDSVPFSINRWSLVPAGKVMEESCKRVAMNIM